MMSEIRKIPEIIHSTSRLISTGMISSSRTATGVKINGIVPKEEASITYLAQKLSGGKYFQEPAKNPIIISQKLADKLQVGIRNKIVITFGYPEGETVNAAFKIIGLYKSNNGQYDQMNVFIRKTDFQALIGEEGMINEIAIKLENTKNSPQVAEQLQKKFPNLLVEQWGDIAPELKLVNESFNQGMQIFITIILLALAFGIINTMLMAVLERVREIGMLMAIGMNKIRIFFMIVLETVMLALIGGPLGILFAWITITWTGRYGIDLSVVAEGLSSFGYANLVYPIIEPEFYVSMALQVFALAVVASIYPAWKAVKLNPVESIRVI